jgi:GcrA cell cycle regulator
MGKRVWSDEVRAQVIKWFTEDGLSYGQISQRLGVSRDVVAGLANRLGLAGKGKTPAQGGWRASTGGNNAAPQVAPRSLIDLGRTGCAWPVGDPKSPEFHFCGQEVEDRSPYCVDHRKKAYSASEPRERDKGMGERQFQPGRDRRALWG